MNIAERALAAHAADEESRRLRKEADTVRNRARAVDAIARATEQFGLTFNPRELVKGHRDSWSVILPVDDDVSLRFEWELTLVHHEENLEIKPKVADQLYYDLPPGIERIEDRTTGGYAYGCYSLEGVHNAIGTLAELGENILRVRRAREQWQKKHGVA